VGYFLVHGDERRGLLWGCVSSGTGAASQAFRLGAPNAGDYRKVSRSPQLAASFIWRPRPLYRQTQKSAEIAFSGRTLRRHGGGRSHLSAPHGNCLRQMTRLRISKCGTLSPGLGSISGTGLIELSKIIGCRNPSKHLFTHNIFEGRPICRCPATNARCVLVGYLSA
jgi:hypothetical protein